MNLIRASIATAPKAALVAGKTAFLLGGVLVVAALFGRVGMIAMNTERAQAKLPPLAKLAEAFPQYPTWIVPEGPVGYTVAAVLILVGMYIAVLAGEALKKEEDTRRGGW